MGEKPTVRRLVECGKRISTAARWHTDEYDGNLYEELGLRPVINAAGAYTLLGGSRLSPAVEAAMAEANRRYVPMRELLAKSGEIVAELVEAEAAYVTAGAASALVLAAAACMTGEDRAKIESLPDTSGMKHEIVIQRSLRVKYDRTMTIPGGRLVEIGDETSTSRQQLIDALNHDTAAVHFLAPGDAGDHLPLVEVIEIAHARGIPVIVDAAGQTYPVDNLRKYVRMGADLACYAGKYVDGPQSTGFVAGRKDLVAAAAMNGFVDFEALELRTIGRAMKIDRQEIVGLVVALKQWLAMDHEDRLLKYAERAEIVLAGVPRRPGIEAFVLSERETPLPQWREAIRVNIDPAVAGVSALEVRDRLKEMTPRVWTFAEGDALTVSVAFCRDGEEEVIAEQLGKALQ
jgi:D-glucosaminate-6-phosphate ammonia-lyase